MKKYLLTIAIVGCAAFCVSAIRPPACERQEIAMARCTKEVKKEKKQDKKEKEDTCKNSTGRLSKKKNWAIRNGYSKEQYKPEPGEIAGQRRSAAQKVIQGY